MIMTNMKIIPQAQVPMSEIADALGRGQTLIYPTETCYGLGCSATESISVQKIFEIKNRPQEKICIILFRDIDHLRKYALLDPATEEKVAPYWPGPLTVRLPVKENTGISPLIISPEGTISCRISPHPFIQELFQSFDGPLVSTSANISGEPSIYTREKILESFLAKPIAPDIFIDGGNLPLNPPSTVIEVKDGKVTILRQGSITIH